MALLAKGSQDRHLTSHPQMSFWKACFKRHTNFSSESIQVLLTGDTSFGGLCRAVLPRKGDLVTDIYLSVELPAVSVTGPDPAVKWTNSLGHALIEYVEVAIGGEVIDRHTGEWLEIHSQLYMTDEKQKTYHNMIGNKGSLINEATELAPQYLYIPLQFWFNKNDGVALPIAALQVHDVEIRIKLRRAEDLYVTFDADNVVTAGRLDSVSLFVNYIQLDSAERKAFATKEHQYLIEQVQYGGQNDVGGARGTGFDISFNHPVKELFWMGQREVALRTEVVMNSDGYPDYNDYFNFSSSASPGAQLNMFDKFLIQLNGTDLLSEREANYFNLYVPWKHHTNAPEIGVYCYSFAREPERYQPTGTLNFSRLSSAFLKCTFNDAAVLPCVMRVYAVNYNILSFSCGQAALEYTM